MLYIYLTCKLGSSLLQSSGKSQKFEMDLPRTNIKMIQLQPNILFSVLKYFLFVLFSILFLLLMNDVWTKVSISPTFYEQFFYTKVFCVTFLFLTVCVYIFLAKPMGNLLSFHRRFFCYIKYRWL